MTLESHATRVISIVLIVMTALLLNVLLVNWGIKVLIANSACQITTVWIITQLAILVLISISTAMSVPTVLHAWLAQLDFNCLNVIVARRITLEMDQHAQLVPLTALPALLLLHAMPANWAIKVPHALIASTDITLTVMVHA